MTKRMLNRSLSLLLALVMCAGLLPLPARADGGSVWLNLDGASSGPASQVYQIPLAVGYADGNDHLSIVAEGASSTLYYNGSGESVRRLVLYSSEQLSELSLAGNAAFAPGSSFVEGCYGENSGMYHALYYYVAEVTVSGSFQVKSGTDTVADVTMSAVGGTPDKPLIATIYVKDHTITNGALSSFVVRISGFGLPTSAASYALDNGYGQAPLYCQGLNADGAGLDLTFTVPSGSSVLGWPYLYIDDEAAFYFSGSCLSDGSFRALSTDDGSIVDRCSDHLSGSTEAYPSYLGNNANFPSPEQCLFRPIELAEPETAPTVTLAANTVDAPSFDAAITCGSYAGGTMTVTANGTELIDYWSGGQLSDGNITVRFTDKGERELGRGSYSLAFRFTKSGLRTYTVTKTLTYPFTDEHPPYFASAGVTAGTNAVVNRCGAVYLLSPANAEQVGSDFNFRAVPSAEWAASIGAQVPDVYLKFYDATGGVYQPDSPMVWNSYYQQFHQYNAYEDIKDAVKAVVTCELPGCGTVTTEILLSLTTPEGYRAVTYAPSIPSHPVAITTTSGTGSEAVTQTTTVNVVNEGDNIECVVKVPSSDIGTGYGQTATLTYTIPGNSSPQTTTVDIGSVSGGEGKPTEIKADIPIPEGADTITGVTYTMTKPQEGGGTETVTTFDVPLPETGYRIGRPLQLTGIPAAYEGAVLTLTAPEGNPFAGYENTFTVPAPVESVCTVDCGDLPYGSYNYEISGKSGFITRGSFTFSEENKVEGVFVGVSLAEALPALYTLTVGVTAADANVLAYGGIPADVDLTLTVPDGTESGKAVKLTGALTSNGEIKVPGATVTDVPTDKTIAAVPAVFAQLPAGTKLAATALRYDAGAYPDVSRCDSGLAALTEGERTLNADADLSTLFTFQPFSRHTITGTVAHPEGTTAGPHVTVALTQNVTRGGVNEVYTASATVDKDNKFTLEVYDGFGGKLEFRSLLFGNQTQTFAAGIGNRNLGSIQLENIETTIQVNLNVKTPSPITRRGTRYYDAAESAIMPADSGTLLVKSVTTSLGTYTPGQTLENGAKAFDTLLVDGQLLIKVNSAAGTPANVTFLSPMYRNGEEMSLVDWSWSRDGSKCTVYGGANHGGVTPYVSVNAILSGGEVRGTVVGANDAGYTGFLCLIGKQRFNTPLSCTFVSGKGELRLPYTAAQVGDYYGVYWKSSSNPNDRGNLETAGARVFSIKCRDEDVEAVSAMLASDLQTVLDKLNNGLGRQQERPEYRTVLPANSYVYMEYYPENMKPHYSVGSEILPAWTFQYTTSLTADSQNKDAVLISGTLKKRATCAPDADLLRQIRVTIPGEQVSGFTSSTGNTTTKTVQTGVDFTVNGKKSTRDTVTGETVYYMSGSATEVTLSMVVPLDYYNRTNFSIDLTMLKEAGKENYSNAMRTQRFTYEDNVDIFALSGPDEVYIADQCRAQNKYVYTTGKREYSDAWSLKLALRATYEDNPNNDPDMNKVTIWDNGVAVSEYKVTRSLYNNAGSHTSVWVKLTDNLKPGLHVLYASRVYKGQTIYTQPLTFMLREENTGTVGGVTVGEPYVTDISWKHKNWKNNGIDTETMHFSNLSDMAGFTFWLWPGLNHEVSFRVNNASPSDLESVTFVEERPNGDEKRVPCHQVNPAGDPALWGFGDENDPVIQAGGKVSFSSLEGFRIEFQYKKGSFSDQIQNAANYTERRQLELQQFCAANGFEAPNDAEAAAHFAKGDYNDEMAASVDNLTGPLSEVAHADASAFTKDAAGTTYTGTGDIRSLRYEASMGETKSQKELWLLMEQEQKNNLSDDQTAEPASAGWRVYWSVTEDLNGYTFTRMAVQDLKSTNDVKAGADDGYGGKYTAKSGVTIGNVSLGSYFENSLGEQVYAYDTYYHYRTRQTVWLPPAVNTALGGTNPTASLEPVHNIFASDDRLTVRSAIVLAGSGDALEDVAKEDGILRQGYNLFSDGQAVVDMAQEVYLGAIKASYADWMVDSAKRGEEAVKDARFMPESVGTVMNVLGTLDAAYQIYQGPSGADGSVLYQLTNNIKDEGIRNSVKAQIRDYVSIRRSIYINDSGVNVMNAVGGWVDGVSVPVKAAMFVGTKINGAISDASKDYNRQAYNSILHLICDQIQYERMKASIPEAENWLRDKMDKIYGKGRWSEYQFMQEKLNWVLTRDKTTNMYHYVWKTKAPKFNVYHDPAGYVFEATETDRLAGVTATLYGSDAENGDYSVWADTNADETLRQLNPQTTPEDGTYRWMVPSGWWKVQYQKEGYLDAESIAMQVPPEHTEVNIGMLATAAPQASVNVGTDNITVLFTRYMQLESLLNLYGADADYTAESFNASAFKVRFYNADGNALEGTVTFPDKVANTGYKGTGYGRDVIASDWFVRTAVFTPYEPSDLTGATYALAGGMLSYAGVDLDGAASLVLVSFDANGGSYTLPDQVIASGGKATLYDAARDGYDFGGWYNAAVGGTEVTADQTYTAGTTLYAHWEKITAAAPEPLGTGNLRVGEVLDDQGNGTGRMGATVFAGADALGGVLMLAAYDMEGRLIKVVTKTITSAEIDTETGDISIEMPANKDIALVSAFVLNKDYVPLVGKQSR